MESYRVFVGVIEREGGARIVVARLSNRTRIHEIFCHLLQVDFLALVACFGFVSRDQNMEEFLTLVYREAALYVGVPEKREPRLGLFQQRIRLTGHDDVLVFIARGAMHALHALSGRDRAFGQCLEKFHVFGSKPFVGPHGSERRHRIEAFYAFEAGASLVMIAADKDLAQSARALRHLIGTCAVTDNIAQIEYQVVLRRCIEADIPRVQGDVEVRKNGYAARKSTSSVSRNRKYAL